MCFDIDDKDTNILSVNKNKLMKELDVSTCCGIAQKWIHHQKEGQADVLWIMMPVMYEEDQWGMSRDLMLVQIRDDMCY